MSQYISTVDGAEVAEDDVAEGTDDGCFDDAEGAEDDGSLAAEGVEVVEEEAVFAATFLSRFSLV